MLVSLTIRNFVLIEDAVLEFSPGLTVLTGETGAGKTLLTRALGLLAGERAEDGLVGPAADEASIQAVFDIDPSCLAETSEEIRALVPLEPGELIVIRRLSREGRNRCYINGMAVTLGTMGEVMSRLLSFAGQHEYRRLLDPGYQLEVVDRWAGPHVVDLAARYRRAFVAAHDAERRLEEGERLRNSRAREIELLRFQVGELTEARLSPEEEGALLAEQSILARAEDILRGVGTATDLLSNEADRPDAVDLVGQASAQLAGLAGVDDSLDAIGSALSDIHYQIIEVSRDLRAHLDKIAVDPQRLQAVDSRLRQYADLTRKYGGSTTAAVAYLADSLERLTQLERESDDLRDIEEIYDAQRALALELACQLSEERKAAIPRLEQVVAGQLADLGMAGTAINVHVQRHDEWGSLRDVGAESVEFMLVADHSRTPRSLARTASGGELSRVLLALKCALAGAGGNETLVLDEIDAGIGGRTAVAVGRKLRELASQSQLIVVTHLARVAALADRHYLIDKVRAEGSASTRLSPLEGEHVVEELCRMMGGRPEDTEAMAHARELRDRAAGGLLD